MCDPGTKQPIWQAADLAGGLEFVLTVREACFVLGEFVHSASGCKLRQHLFQKRCLEVGVGLVG